MNGDVEALMRRANAILKSLHDRGCETMLIVAEPPIDAFPFGKTRSSYVGDYKLLDGELVRRVAFCLRPAVEIVKAGAA